MARRRTRRYIPSMLRLAASLCVIGIHAGCAPASSRPIDLPPPSTAARVDLQRYAGTWYEIAAFPARFQRGCTATTATYALRPDGDLDVVNRCRRGSPTAPVESAYARARVADPTTNARLRVSFFRPFWNDYWILDVGPDYEWAVVGHPSRDLLWILARAPVLEEAVYRRIVERLRADGFETDRLVRTVHALD